MFNNIHEQPLRSSQQPNMTYAEHKCYKVPKRKPQTDEKFAMHCGHKSVFGNILVLKTNSAKNKQVDG